MEVEDASVAAAAPAVAEESTDDLRDPKVVDRYRAAGNVCQQAMAGAVAKAVAGAAVADVCEFVDALIETLCSQAFKNAGKSKITGAVDGLEKSKGVAFPTCLSVNETVSHCSPFKADKDVAPLAAGDMVKM